MNTSLGKIFHLASWITTFSDFCLSYLMTSTTKMLEDVTYKKMFYKTSQNSQRNTCATFQKHSNCWLPLTSHQILRDVFLNKLWENDVETKSYVKTDWRLILFSQGLLTRKFLQFWQYFAVTMIYSCLRPFWRCSHASMRSMRLFPFMEMSF